MTFTQKELDELENAALDFTIEQDLMKDKIMVDAIETIYSQAENLLPRHKFEVLVSQLCMIAHHNKLDSELRFENYDFGEAYTKYINEQIESFEELR